jgi:diguanylate cyclase (GGDEF)-like protein
VWENLRVDVPKLPAAVLTGIVVGLCVTVVEPVRRWLLQTVEVRVVVLVLLIVALAGAAWFAARQASSLRRLRQQVADLQQDTRIDPLTKALRKAEIDRVLADRCLQAHKSSQSLSVIFIDIDKFKRINDTHGHETGDFVLAQFGDVIRPRSPHDLLFRFGGDEFLIVTKLEQPEGVLSKGYAFARRLQREVDEWPFLVDRTTPARERLTISCGVTDLGQGNDGPDALIQRADAACMRAKALGGNSVEQLGS